MTERAVVLVTGATGFLGRPTVKALVSRGAEVHALSRSGRSVPGATAWPVDLFDAERVSETVRAIRATHLLHLAWDVTPGRFWTDPENLAWISASLHLSRSFVEAGGMRLVGIGTSAEYDWTHADLPFHELDSPIRPATLYGVAKDAVRRVLEKYCNDVGVAWAWGRVFAPYGPGEPSDKLIASVIGALLANQPAICSAGTQLRDFLYAADVGDALSAITLSGVVGCVNVASGVGTTVGQIVAMIGDLIGRPDLIRLGERPVGPLDSTNVVANVQRLKSEVGWLPIYGLKQGLEETIRAARMVA